MADKLIGKHPRQQFVDAIDGMLGDASDDVAQVGLRIKAIQFGGSCRFPNYAELRDGNVYGKPNRARVFGIVWSSSRPGDGKE